MEVCGLEEAKKILKGMFYNDNGEKMHYIDFSDSYGDEWGGYTLPEYIEAMETVLNELYKKDKVIDFMANSLTTDYHDTEWVKEYYYKLVEGNIDKK